jgi:DNA-directed RNA polymerase specialized sigma subunit
MPFQLTEHQIKVLEDITGNFENRTRQMFKAWCFKLTQREISIVFNTSERTVRREIKKVKNFLSKSGRNSGCYIEE